jgi:hypothetical protein
MRQSFMTGIPTLALSLKGLSDDLSDFGKRLWRGVGGSPFSPLPPCPVRRGERVTEQQAPRATVS